MQEFHSRVVKKRQLIEQTKLKCKELALRDTTIICERCKQDLALLKTVDFVSEDLHFAKCAFGFLRRVEVADALTEKYTDDSDLVQLYVEMQKEEKLAGTAAEDFGFCECRKGHIVGIMKNQRYYFTDISQVQLMFPGSVYEAWDSRFWQPKYKAAFQLQDQLNYTFLQKQKQNYMRDGRFKGNKSVPSVQVRCELCQIVCGDSEDFIIHCKKDPTHRELETKFTDETFDFLFKAKESVQTKELIMPKMKQ